MAYGDSAFDRDLAGTTIESTEVTAEGVVLAAVRVNADETSAREPVFGALGVGGRPLPPAPEGEEPAAAEAICARASDGLPVIATRDLRIEKARAEEPAEGTLYHAGYYGAEVRFDVVAGEERSTVTVTDNAGRELVLDDQGVRVPTSALIQGNPSEAEDVALARHLIVAMQALDTFCTTVSNTVPELTPACTALKAALLPYVIPSSAPTTRAPDLRGEPGA